MNTSETCSHKCLGIPVADRREDADSVAAQIILADSQTAYRIGIWQILKVETSIQVMAQVNNLTDLGDAIERYFGLQLSTESVSHIVLLENNMISGKADAISRMVCRAPQLKIIVQSAQHDETNAVELYLSGVQGIIPRSVPPDLLVKCVRKVAAGETWIDNRCVTSVIKAFRVQATRLNIAKGQLRLSANELAIIAYIMQGQRNKVIPRHLGTTEQTIKNHLRTLYKKLRVSGRLELAFYGLRHHSSDIAAIGTPLSEPAVNDGKLDRSIKA
jgi:DNA-binding NarL/FixJ family response regulator